MRHSQCTTPALKLVFLSPFQLQHLLHIRGISQNQFPVKVLTRLKPVGLKTGILQYFDPLLLTAPLALTCVIKKFCTRH